MELLVYAAPALPSKTKGGGEAVEPKQQCVVTLNVGDGKNLWKSTIYSTRGEDSLSVDPSLKQSTVAAHGARTFPKSGCSEIEITQTGKGLWVGIVVTLAIPRGYVVEKGDHFDPLVSVRSFLVERKYAYLNSSYTFTNRAVIKISLWAYFERPKSQQTGGIFSHVALFNLGKSYRVGCLTVKNNA